MAESPPPAEALCARLADLGRSLGERESAHGEALAAARRHAEDLRGLVAQGLDAFHGAAREVGAPQLQVELSPVRADDKHLRSIEFDLQRGRHRAIVTVKSRGDVTLVGPFHSGKAEGPCKTFPVNGREELYAALAGFIESFLEEASSP